VELLTPQGPFALRFSGAGALRQEESWSCSEFGKRARNQTLAWSNRERRSYFGFCLAPARQIESFDLRSGAQVARRRYGWSII
jgi:hypothetical protein